MRAPFFFFTSLLAVALPACSHAHMPQPSSPPGGRGTSFLLFTPVAFVWTSCLPPLRGPSPLSPASPRHETPLLHAHHLPHTLMPRVRPQGFPSPRPIVCACARQMSGGWGGDRFPIVCLILYSVARFPRLPPTTIPSIPTKANETPTLPARHRRP